MVKQLDKTMIDVMGGQGRVKDILFKPDLVGAIRRREKTETRRTRGLKKYNERPDDWTKEDILAEVKCPYGERGDWLRIRENWTFWEREDGKDFVEYQAGGRMGWPKIEPQVVGCTPEYKYPGNPFEDKGYKPSIHMPRWCRRLMLENGVVDLERLQEITDEGARAEGLYKEWDGTKDWYAPSSRSDKMTPYPITAFMELWDIINGKKLPSKLNPWVWKVPFILIEDRTTEETDHER